MRKKTINKLFDGFMWYLIYLMPLFLFIGVSIRTGQFLTLSQAFNSIGLNILTDNVVLTTLSDIFGSGGVLPLFQTNDFLIYCSYFISVFVIHLAVDCVLFIPRLAHKWLNSFTSGGAD